MTCTVAEIENSLNWGQHLNGHWIGNLVVFEVRDVSGSPLRFWVSIR